MSYAVLELASANLTIDLQDGVNYALVSWAPAVSARERALMGSYSPYVDVLETITVNVYGKTAGEALGALDDINVILENAEAWWMGDAVEPVLMRVQMAGSVLDGPLEAVVLGRPDDRSAVALQPSFNHDLLLFEIANVEIALVRRGLWLGPETDRASSGTLTNPGVMSLDMGEATRRLSPTTVRVTGFGPNTSILGGGFLVMSGVSPASQNGRNIAIYAAAVMTSSEFSAVDDSANGAHGNNVMRIDAVSNTSGALLISAINTGVSRISVFAAVRNNSSTSTWRTCAVSTGYVTVSDGWRIIDAASQHPQIIYVGTLANQSGTHSNLRLDFATDDSTGTLDVNYVVIVGHDASMSSIAIVGADYSSEAFPRALVVDPRATTHRTPLLYIETVAA